jgi:hypothetical protein
MKMDATAPVRDYCLPSGRPGKKKALTAISSEKKYETLVVRQSSPWSPI